MVNHLEFDGLLHKMGKICPKCKKGIMRSPTTSETTLIHQILYYCDNCGYTEYGEV